MNAIAEVEVDNSLQQSLDRLKAAYAAEPYPSLMNVSSALLC